MLKKILLVFVVMAAVLVARPVFMIATATPLHPQPQGVPSATQAAPSARWSAAVDRARQITRAALVEENLPGLSVAVGAGGEIVWAEGFGWADLEMRAPVTPDTRFRIGTASPVLTSAAVGVLLEKDRLNLDEEIQAYVPQFPRKQWPVTLRQLMGHTAGVGTDSVDDRPLSRQRCERPVEALPRFADAALLFEPGTQSRHSKYGWILVSAAVEAAAGQPFLTFMQGQIFQPLGMQNTGAESSREENPEAIGEAAEDPPPFRAVHELILKPWGIAGARTRSATAPATYYARGFGPGPVLRHGLHATHVRNLSCYAGSMAFFSTPSDLVRFSLAIDSGRLLQPATVQSLQSSLQPTPEQEKTVSLMTLRERGIVVAVMSNITDADTSALALKVAEAFTH